MKSRNSKKISRTDWRRLAKMRDKNIDFSDIRPLDKSFFFHAKLRLPEPKSTITIRLDPDILMWFREKGRGYQTRINAILRMYMQAQER